MYSYDEDDMVQDPKLSQHLQHFGINIAQLEKVDFKKSKNSWGGDFLICFLTWGSCKDICTLGSYMFNLKLDGEGVRDIVKAN